MYFTKGACHNLNGFELWCPFWHKPPYPSGTRRTVRFSACCHCSESTPLFQSHAGARRVLTLMMASWFSCYVSDPKAEEYAITATASPPMWFDFPKLAKDPQDPLDVALMESVPFPWELIFYQE